MGLFNSTILDVVIGMIFVYLLLAILCTAANELIAAFSKRRGETLRQGIKQLIGGQALSDELGTNSFLNEFYQHPLITSIMHDKNHPAYISPRTFSTVVTDLLTLSKPGVVEFKDLEIGAKALPDGHVKKAILALVQRSDSQLENAQSAIETWFNDSMDRVSGWYKRRTQLWTIFIAAALTIISNADTTQIAKKLWTDPVLRAEVVEEAKVRANKPRPGIMVEYEDEQDPTKPTVTKTADDEGNRLSEKEREILGQLIGWHGVPERSFTSWAQRIIGWLLTVLALSMGAPFWFDLLNKIMNVRYAGKSPDEKPKEPEKPTAAAVRA